ncbi:MAG: N-acetylglucosamine-6-phosphate deacetylase [Clostridia bacterium]|nr:N-acetylglucosamine-6-phosphate deacetylase [Clostridia bacterium]
MKRIKSSRIICGDEIKAGYVYYEDGKITEVSSRELPYTKEYDAKDLYVSPGFIDIHTHGGGGFPFEGTVDDVVNGCNFHLKHGTTSICPTISAAYFDSMKRSVQNIASAMTDNRVKANVIGAHMEGPYLSLAQTGAQGSEFITPPIPEDYEPLIDEYGQYIARWTYAPENDKNAAFAKHLASHGIVASAGHTNAIGDEMKPAIENGCRLITHLYSCTSTITRDHGFRRLGVIETAFLEDDVFVEIIADGKHLPSDLIRLIYKIKGSDRIALVTDSLALAGTDIKHGFMQSTEFIIEDGVCKLMDRSAFAGSVATADRLVRVITQEVGLPLTEAVKMMTATPAAIMGLNKGALAAGYDADFVIFDDDVCVCGVFAGGEQIEL